MYKCKVTLGTCQTQLRTCIVACRRCDPFRTRIHSVNSNNGVIYHTSLRGKAQQNTLSSVWFLAAWPRYRSGLSATFCLHSRRFLGVKSSGMPGEKLNICRYCLVPGSNLATVTFSLLFCPCFQVQDVPKSYGRVEEHSSNASHRKLKEVRCAEYWGKLRTGFKKIEQNDHT